MKKKLRRSFGGKLDKYKFADKEERAFEKRHLKAYLRGDKQFTYGKDSITREPFVYNVMEKWTEE